MAIALHHQPIAPRTYRPASRPGPRPALAATRRRPAHVYARRRALLAVVVGLIVGGGFFARSAVAENPAPVGGIEMPRTVTAVQGDTLWAIAHRLAPGGDVLGMVDRLVKLNGDRIVPGQQILIP